MRRREFISLLGSAAASWPLAVRSQQAARVGQVGVLMVLSENDPVAQAQLTAFRKALQEKGWTEGHNVRRLMKISRRNGKSSAENLRAA